MVEPFVGVKLRVTPVSDNDSYTWRVPTALGVLQQYKLKKLDDSDLQYCDPIKREWITFDTSSRFNFVAQCQELGLFMSDPITLAALDEYFGDEG